jgi:hypothetical protein
MRIRTTSLISLCIGILPFASGCQDYKWQWNYQSPEQLQAIEQKAFEQHKIVFIFYKSFFDSDRMHSEVLADSRVGSLFNDTVNIIIDKSAGPAYERYLTKYGITAPPACVLASSDCRYKVFTGFIPKDRFVEMVKAAKAELSEPAHRPPPSKVAP